MLLWTVNITVKLSITNSYGKHCFNLNSNFVEFDNEFEFQMAQPSAYRGGLLQWVSVNVKEAAALWFACCSALQRYYAVKARPFVFCKTWENERVIPCVTAVFSLTSIIHNNILSTALSINTSKLRRIFKISASVQPSSQCCQLKVKEITTPPIYSFSKQNKQEGSRVNLSGMQHCRILWICLVEIIWCFCGFSVVFQLSSTFSHCASFLCCF